MAKSGPESRPKARLPKGFADIGAADLRASRAMLDAIRAVYERYGFEPLETPSLEYTDALGKFLPDQDRPNAGVFSMQDDDEQWLSLRYDLTAPLARYVAENFANLPKPFRRYQTGLVYRNEKPGPGRFRQFTQFDADTVGSESVAADAEMCMLAADALEALGVPRGQYVIKVSNRKVLDGLFEVAGLGDSPNSGKKHTALRALDKIDKIGLSGVKDLLGKGRKDESGDFTKGAELSAKQIELLMDYFDHAQKSTKSMADAASRGDAFNNEIDQSYFVLRGDGTFYGSEIGSAGVQELEEIRGQVRVAGFGMDRVRIDPSVVRGLEYYTGPVYEAELLFEVKNEDGQKVRFGSVGGGGRYDDLVARFTGERVPATGFSMGVSRLQAALAALKGPSATAATPGPVVVLVMEKDRLAEYQKLTQSLRQAGIRAEMYLGSSGMKAQMKYADKRNAPVAVIQGSDERAKGEVTLKDLVAGAKAAAAITDNKAWKEARPAQVSVPEAKLVDAVAEILARHRAGA